METKPTDEQIREELYKNYVNKIKLQNNWEVTLRVMNVDTIGQQELLSKEEFISKIKTDEEFAKKWGDLGLTKQKDEN